VGLQRRQTHSSPCSGESIPNQSPVPIPAVLPTPRTVCPAVPELLWEAVPSDPVHRIHLLPV